MFSFRPGVSLDPVKVADTTDVLSRRIRERFPASGLGGVSLDVVLYARGAEALSISLGRPRWLLRALGLLVAILVSAGLGTGLSRVEVRPDVGGLSDFIQGIDALLQSTIYACVAGWFLLSLESRLKRSQVLRELRSLRSLAHVIDMHQLDKEPEATLLGGVSTASSPERGLSRFELSRYLEYCSELLALTAKLAAIYVQRAPDPVCLEAASDIEAPCLGLIQKISQKSTLVVLLDR